MYFKCFALLQYAIIKERERESNVCACACVCAPTFFFIITVKNRQNPWHTITKHKQASCNHSCPTRRTKRIFHPVSPSLPTGTMQSGCCDVVVCCYYCWDNQKTARAKQNEWWRTTADDKRWMEQQQTDGLTRADGRRQATTHCIMQCFCFYAFYFMLSGPTAVVDVVSSSSSSGWGKISSASEFGWVAVLCLRSLSLVRCSCRCIVVDALIRFNC